MSSGMPATIVRSRVNCKVQMIMGAGKTTVVGPLLAMLLADSNTLMMEVARSVVAKPDLICV